MQHQKSHRTIAKRPRRRRESESVLRAANGYIVRHYPFGCLGENPRRLVGEKDIWVVPVFLTSPGLGALGEVGLVALEARTRQVVGATEREEVNRAIKQLRESRGHEIEDAFHRARTI